MVQYEMSVLEQEYLKVFLLDTRNRLMDIVEVYHGSLNSAQIRIAEVFKPAIQRQAASIILCHNHPSGATPRQARTMWPLPRPCGSGRQAAGRGFARPLDHRIGGKMGIAQGEGSGI